MIQFEQTTETVMDRVKELDKRLRELVTANTRETRRNADLEELTRIPASQWASWWLRRAKPSAEMLSAVCSKWPESALWLMTGAVDVLGGQVCPDTPAEKRQPASERYLRRLAEVRELKAGAAQEGGGDDLSEWEVDELNALHDVRKRELQRRLANDDKTQ